METFKTIPLTIQRVEDLHENNTQNSELKQYKKRVREFVKKVEEETMLLLQKHSKEVSLLKEQINSLQKQNQQLKNKRNVDKRNQIDEAFDSYSPIRLKADYKPKLSLSPRTFSDPFKNISKSNFLSTQFKSTIQKDQQFPLEIIDPQDTIAPFNKSRFQINSKKKKIRQQELIQSIQSGGKNLQHNTVKLFQLIGRAQKPVQQSSEEAEQSKEVKEKDEELNASLGAICESLNNSFASKKSRSKQRKNVEALESEKKKKKEQEEERIQKERGVKNLLKSLRECVNSSPKKELETIKGSKLLNAGGEQNKFKGRTSKVMINPVPVEAERASERSPSKSPVKRSSVLKKSSILSKSIEGISAIAFHSSLEN